MEIDKHEEVQRIKEASARLVRRAQKDPTVAHDFLNDIGYYELMSQDETPDDDTTSHDVAEHDIAELAGR